MKTCLIIPAKGTSERLSQKNLFKINGETLIRRACRKLLNCKNISSLYVDTESEDIICDIKDYFNKGLKLIKRHPLLATNDIGANEMMMYGLHSIEDCDLLLQSFCTSPLLRAETIDRCIEDFTNNGYPKHDSFFTVLDTQEYFWKNGRPENFSTKELPNSFELDKIQMETHGLYGVTTQSLLKNKTRVGENPMLINIPKIESIDINEKGDIDLVERLLNVTE